MKLGCSESTARRAVRQRMRMKGAVKKVLPAEEGNSPEKLGQDGHL